MAYARETPIARTRVRRNSLGIEEFAIAAGYAAFFSFFALDGISRRASRRRFLCHSTVVGCIAGIRLPGARLSTCDRRVGRPAGRTRNIYGEDNREKKEREGAGRENDKSAAPSSFGFVLPDFIIR